MIEKTQKSIDNYRKKTEALKDTKPWITEQERTDVLEKVQDFDTWFADVVSKEEALKPHDDSKMEIKDVMKKAKDLQKLFNKISNKKKPKEEKKEEEEDKDEDAEKKSEESTEEEKPKSEENAETKEETKTDDLWLDQDIREGVQYLDQFMENSEIVEEKTKFSIKDRLFEKLSNLFWIIFLKLRVFT